MEPDDFLFPSKQAGYSKITGEITVRRLAKVYAKKAGLPAIKVHEYRHSCASNLLRNNVPLRVVVNLPSDTKATIFQPLQSYVPGRSANRPTSYHSEFLDTDYSRINPEAPHRAKPFYSSTVASKTKR